MQNNKLIEQTISFLSLCGEKDRKFLEVPQKKRKTEDYARLITITLIFGFKQVSMQLLGKAGKRIGEVNEFIIKATGDYTTVKKWLDEFIENITVPKLKAITLNAWKEKSEGLNSDNFDINKLI